MEQGTPEYFRVLHRYLEQLQRQTGGTVGQVDDANIPQIATNTTAAATAQTSADGAQTTADSKVVTFTQASEPTALATGDLWVDTDDDNQLYRWSGSAWVTQRDVTIATAQTEATLGVTNAATAQTAADDAQDDADTAQTTANTGVTNAATAQTDLEANNVTVESLSQLEWTDSAGVWPADSTSDHVLSYQRQLSAIATHTIRVVFVQSTGNFTVTSQAETGEATVETITGSGGKDAKGVVSHTASGIIGKVTAQAVDQSSSGGSPSK